MLGKKLSRKSAEIHFLFSHEYSDQKNGWGGGNALNNFFQNHTNSASKKCWEKKSPQKSAKTRFLYSHEYRDQKVGGKMHETIIPETHE